MRAREWQSFVICCRRSREEGCESEGMGKLCHLWPSIHRGRGMSKFRHLLSSIQRGLCIGKFRHRSGGDWVWVSFVICCRQSAKVGYW